MLNELMLTAPPDASSTILPDRGRERGGGEIEESGWGVEREREGKREGEREREGERGESCVHETESE